MVSFFIHRPVFASVIAVIMVLTGLIAYSLLPVEQFPNITPPQVVVTTTYPGASSQVVADTVTTPLEQQINGVPGMAYMSSVSANDGSSTITVTFNVGYSIDTAAVDVQNRVSQASGAIAGHRQSGRHRHQQEKPEHHAGDQHLVAGRIGRSRHPQQLCVPAACRSGEAPARRRRRQHLRRTALFDARVARSRQARHARRDRHGCPASHPGAKRSGRRRQAGAGAGPAGYRFRVPGRCGGPPERPSAVRRHRHPGREGQWGQ